MKTVQLDVIEKAHLERLYDVFTNMLGKRYTYDVGGLEFCCYLTSKSFAINLEDNLYTFVISPKDQKTYKSIIIKGLNIKDIMIHVNQIVHNRHQDLWETYFAHLKNQ